MGGAGCVARRGAVGISGAGHGASVPVGAQKLRSDIPENGSSNQSMEAHANNGKGESPDDGAARITEVNSSTAVKKKKKRGDRQQQDGPQPKKLLYRVTSQQLEILEGFFSICAHPDDIQRRQLNESTGLSVHQVKFWFQNKRTHVKHLSGREENYRLKVENEMLKEENNRLIRQEQSNAPAPAPCPRCINDAGHLLLEKEVERLKALNQMLQQELQLQGTDGETHRHSSLSDLVYWSIKVSTAYNPLCFYQLSFTRSEFSMAFPYVSTSVDEKLEDSLLSSFTENCNNGFGRNRTTYTDTCTGQDLKKYHNMDAINDLVVSGVASRRVNHPSGQTDVIVFCSGGFENPGTAKSEGELLSQLVDLLDLSGAKYTVLYASQPSGLLESPSGLPLGRHLAEKKTNGTKAAQGEKEKCDGECLVKSSLLEGTFVGIVLLIILISGLMCMMGIDTPSRFEAPQES